MRTRFLARRPTACASLVHRSRRRAPSCSPAFAHLSSERGKQPADEETARAPAETGRREEPDLCRAADKQGSIRADSSPARAQLRWLPKQGADLTWRE
jgi:hypothetical protein